jgi:hypothetical protein
MTPAAGKFGWTAERYDAGARSQFAPIGAVMDPQGHATLDCGVAGPGRARTSS